MNCIETFKLTHRFSENEKALKEVDLQVIEGSIYGFLGPNGAGKTTTMKLILGLLKKQQGEIVIFGKPIDFERVEILKRIGATIETPSIYGHLTALENLQILQKVYECPKNRIDEVLKLVGLDRTGNKRTSQFSLGMKQRLSIGISLLHSPQLLILDEPTNGLDPNGILEIRELLIELNKMHGKTILISSHLLSEIEKLVSHIGIINSGELLFQGTLADLMTKKQESAYIVFETNDDTRTSQILGDFDKKLIAGNVAIPFQTNSDIASINRKLVQNGVDVYKISTIECDLEKIFFDVISE